MKRITPITAYEKATTQGLEAVAKQVLAPHFHAPDQVGKKVSLFPCKYAQLSSDASGGSEDVR